MKKISLIILFFCVQLNATIWYVTTTGAGAHTGTSLANAWLMSEMDPFDLNPGDYVYFSQGTYTTTLDTWGATGTAANLITFMPNPANTDTVWINVPAGNAIHNRYCSYIRVKGFASNGSNVAVRTNYPVNVVYIDSIVSIDSKGGANFTTNGNHGCRTMACVADNSDSVFIRWAYVHSNNQTSTGAVDGINATYTGNYFVIGCYIFIGNTPSAGHNDGMQWLQGLGNMYVVNNYIENNKAEHSQGAMIHLPLPGYTGLFYNNTMVHKTNTSVGWAFEPAADPYNTFPGTTGQIYVIHNTHVGNNSENMGHTFYQAVDPCESCTCAADTGTVQRISIWNNIFYSSGGDPPEIRSFTEPFGGNGDSIKVNYNVIYRAGESPNAWYTGGGCSDGAHNYTLTQMRDDYGESANDILATTTGQIAFTNYSTDDFSLQGTSVAKNAGGDFQALIESLGFEWETFNNPYISWSDPIPRDASPHSGSAGAVDDVGGAADTIPSFSFTALTGKELNEEYIATSHITGTDTVSHFWTTTAALFKINYNGTYNTSMKTADPDNGADTVYVKNTTGGSYSTLYTETIVGGGQSRDFNVTTKAEIGGGFVNGGWLRGNTGKKLYDKNGNVIITR